MRPGVCRNSGKSERNRIWCGPRRRDGRFSGRERPASSSAVGPCLIPRGKRGRRGQSRRDVFRCSSAARPGHQILDPAESFPLNQAHGTRTWTWTWTSMEDSFDGCRSPGGCPTRRADWTDDVERRRRPLLVKVKGEVEIGRLAGVTQDVPGVHCC